MSANKQPEQPPTMIPNAVLEISTGKLQSLPTEPRTSNFAHAEMVFPHNKFPSHENSGLHISAMERNDSLNCFKKDLESKPGLGMKRPACLDNTRRSPTAEKRKRMDSPFFMKEEISEADFQMGIIKRGLAMKKDWVYRQVLQNLGVESSPGSFVLESKQHERDGDFKQASGLELSMKRQLSGMPYRFYKSRDGTKVHDEEGNCYIDEDDFKSFYRPKGNIKGKYYNGQIQHETTAIDNSDLRFTPKRNLNFTFHGSNGGVAIDHDTLPKVIGIHSVPRKGRPDNERRTQQHVEAKVDGSTYKTIMTLGETTALENKVKDEQKWWPPSPESISEEGSHDGEGLLKVMTPEDMKAYGLPKQEKLETNAKLDPSQGEDDDEVIVTQVKRVDNSLPRVSNEMEKIQGKIDLHEMPALQLDAHGKPTNYKEILLHYITQQLKNNPQNPSIQKITDDAVAGRPRKAMNMDELCKKLLNTREKLEKEQRKWKRKLLSSLEVVLMKKILKLEELTGEKVPEGVDLQGFDREQCSGSGSQSDIVAVMEDLTTESGDVHTIRCQKITQKNIRSVSSIRGYDSS